MTTIPGSASERIPSTLFAMNKNAWIATEADVGTRLDKWLASATRLQSRRRAFDALSRGRVFVDEVEQTGADARRLIVAGMQVRVWMDRPGSASRRGPRKIGALDILFEDDVIIVLNKPAGLLAVPLPGRPEEPSLAAWVAEHWRSHRHPEPLVVHRIDRDTSGVVVFAHTPEAWRDLMERFARHEPTRRYLGVVLGHPEPAKGTWRTWIEWDEERLIQIQRKPNEGEAREAVTHYEVLESFVEASLVSFELVTGRQHQLRVQAMTRQHPLFGERIYVGAQGASVRQASRRQALHAASLTLQHPVSRKPIVFEAPLPNDLRHVLGRLRKQAKQAKQRKQGPDSSSSSA